MTRSRSLTGVVVAALLLGSCSPAEEAEQEPEPTTDVTTVAEPTPAEPTVAAVEIPDTPVGSMATYLLEALNAEEDLTVGDLEGKLADVLLAEVSAEDLVDLVNSMVRPARPFTPTSFEGVERQAAVQLRSDSGLQMAVSVSVDEQGLLDGIYFTPVAEAEPAETFEEVEQRLEDLGVAAVVRIDGEPVVQTRADEVRPLASVFKLYVLLAVADAVAAGEISWDDTVPLDEAAISLPAPEDGAAPADRTVRELATSMIAVSDNTSTDQLMLLVGREAVERAVVDGGHSDPARLAPFLRTRELFQIAWGADGSRLPEWAGADEQGRREMLDALDGEPLDADFGEVSGEAVWDDGADWFASPTDILAIHETLAAHDDPAVREILSVNPGEGLDLTANAWPYIAFKGGSSVGVLTGAWRAESEDGTVLEVVFLAAEEDQLAVTETQVEFFSLVEDVFRVAAE